MSEVNCLCASRVYIKRNMNLVSNSKLCLRERHLCRVIRCQFSQSVCCKNKNARREGKFFGKLFGTATQKKKKFYVESDIGSKPSLQTLTAVKNKTNKENSRRVHVLNKLFMRNITDLMVTGQHSSDLIGHGLEISRVAVSPDFSKINVYWLAGEKEDNSALEKLLLDVALSLRHELSQLRIMGVVPRIEFVKDKHYERVMNVESLLNRLDLSEDVEVPAHPEIDGVTDMTTKEEYLNIVEESTLPPMQHNTLNLDHIKIMNRIKSAVDRSKALHRKDPNIAIPPPPSSEPETSVTDEMPDKERRRQIAKFLLQRKILREKVLKQEKKYGSDVQLLAQNVGNELPYEFLKYKEPYDSEQDYDYIEEDTDERSNK